MQRNFLYAGFATLALVACAVGWTLTRSSADQGDPNAPNRGDGKPAVPLPIAQVVLFNSGVGYLQREGEVNGDARVEMSFPTGDINDLLKSLVLQDTAGGRVDAISYDSQDPVEKILHSFTLDLNGNPTFAQILNQARGEKIDVMRQEKPGDKPFKVTGTIIGMEAHRQSAGKEGEGTIEVAQLNLLTAEGMLSMPLPQVQSVRFYSATLESEFRRALQVLAGSHDVQKKSVALQFTGNGKRAVKVGYVLERPIWKTTYRLVLEPNGKLFMQGWAIVENTSDDDWNNIRMVLVSGKPISFRMNLYDPLYISRPLVEPELFASLRPPVYGGSINDPLSSAIKPPLPPMAAATPVPTAGGFGGGGGMGGGGAGGRKAGELLVEGKAKGESGGSLGIPLKDAMLLRDKELKRYEDVAKSIVGFHSIQDGFNSIASSQEIGDYFQYVIDHKISLARQKSAMLPIVNQSIEGSKVSIFNEAVHAKFPLLGIRFKNTSGKPLTQGPITVYEDGSYAGDTRTLDLQPNEERLLSYAIDQGTEVKTTLKTNPAPEMTFNIGGNNLTAAYTMRQTKTYTVKNRSTHDRTVLIEHAIRNDWKLVDPKKPTDQSRDVYRFQIEVKVGQTVSQDVIEEQPRTDPVVLGHYAGQDRPPYYALFGGIEIRPEVKGTGPKLLSLGIRKGVLEATYNEKESKTYFIQNQSERDHSFTVNHIIRKDWTRLVGGEGEGEKKNQVGPAVYTFKVEVKSKKTAHQEVVEQRVFLDDTKVVLNLDDDSLRKFIAHQAPTAKVKEALQQVLDQRAKLKTAQQQLADEKSNLKILADDQARVRENLKIIPQTSEHYKDFLKKFVAQEAQIEDAQRAIRTQEAAVQKMQKEYEVFVTGLTVQ